MKKASHLKQVDLKKWYPKWSARKKATVKHYQKTYLWHLMEIRFQCVKFRTCISILVHTNIIREEEWRSFSLKFAAFSSDDIWNRTLGYMKDEFTQNTYTIFLCLRCGIMWKKGKEKLMRYYKNSVSLFLLNYIFDYCACGFFFFFPKKKKKKKNKCGFDKWAMYEILKDIILTI